jgi:hypothetical protein
MYHFHVRYMSKATNGSTERVMQYITRTGRFKKRGDQVREVISLHMPKWAVGVGAKLYWQSADSTASRANARSAYMIEFALPKLLSPAQQRSLVLEYAASLSDLSAENLTAHAAVPMTMAIHEGKGRNPHIHMLVSSSIHDGIERVPGLWFARYNSKQPERGGAKRSRAMTKKSWLVRARELWAIAANRALSAAGIEANMDHRSHAARGIPIEPAMHLGPSAAHLLRQSKPAPRVQRYRSVQERNADAILLNDQIAQTRKRLVTLQEIRASELRIERDWRAMDLRMWQDLLFDHPLARDAKSIKESATVIMLEDVGNRAPAPFVVEVVSEFDQKVAERLPADWQSIRTPAGLWLLRPDLDQVVFCGPGYLTTDADDPGAFQALLTAVSLLPIERPVIAAKPNLMDALQASITSLGKSWVVRALKNHATKSLQSKP